jgi:transcriptional regulator with XRE-family HTH domain
MRELRQQQNFSQEDMILFGFSGKHWQQLEAGRPITVTTLLRACEALGVPIADVVKDLDKGIYEKRSTIPMATLKKISGKQVRKPNKE